MTTVAIVGCTHAGTFAATSILKQHPDWTVHVFERNDSLSFLSCGIALWVGDHVSDPKRMFYSSPKALAEAGATMHMRHDVLDVDVAGKVLRARDMNTGEVSEYRYDKLVITTGSAPVVPPIDGLDEALESGRVLLCKNWDHAMAIKERAGSAKSAVVIGAGYIGAEIAEQFSEIGVKTTLVDALDRVLANNFDATITDDVEQAFDEHGVTLALGQKVTAFRPAAGSDDYMRASLPDNTVLDDVFAAGDSATVRYNPTGADDYIPLATNAVRQGLLIGENIVAATKRYPGTQATSAVQLYDLAMSATGLTAGGAKRRGIAAKSTTITQDYRPDFMLTTTPVTTTLVWSPVTRRILGAQFLSKHDISQAANVVSVAIQAGFTIDQLAGADLFFQPNFSQPINFVGAVAIQAVAES